MDVVEGVATEQTEQTTEQVTTTEKTEVKPETPVEKPAEPAKPQMTVEELQKKFDRDAAMQRRKYERDLQTEREQRIRLEERLAQHAPAKVSEPEMPTIDKFDNFEDYVTAKAEYIAAKKIQDTLSEHEKRQQEQRAQAARQQTVESWNKRIASADIPDFHDVVASSDVPMTTAMQDAIMESEVGPRLAYHLATHPEEAEQIARMTPIGAVRALTQIEDRLLKAANEAKTTNAPPPVRPAGSSASGKKDPGKMTDAEYMKWRKAG